MSLTNSQYNELMRSYEEKQRQASYIAEKHKEEVYEKVPALRSIDDTIAAESTSYLKRMLKGEAEEGALHEKIEELKKKKISLIREAGYSPEYLEPSYSCKDCSDTGYIGNKRCHCFIQASIDLVYSQTGIKDILKEENFDTFKTEYYSDTATDPERKMTSRDIAVEARDYCKEYCRNFDREGGNILITGQTGTGKTFLSHCIAKDLLDAGHSVLYFTSYQLFEVFEKNTFEKDPDFMESYDNIFTSDLIIIDDLGTEMANGFTNSRLFLCLNERLLSGRSTVISTNLSVRDIAEEYSERTFSRIFGNYKLLKLYGEDIRIKKKLLNA